MGRLLEALKRLESEMPARRTVEPIVEVENLPEVMPSASGTAVLERPTDLQEELPLEISPRDGNSEPSSQSGETDCRSCEDATQVSSLSYGDISEKIENLFQLFEGELPLCNNTVMEATLDRAESEISTADAALSASDVQTSVAEPETDNNPEVSLAKPETKHDSSVFLEKPETHKDPGVFGAMARNILAQLPVEESVTLFITSPTDGEGKTETILPLAEAIVEASGRRTILVDANLHRPDLTREWQFSSRRGLFDVLTGEADWWEAVQETGLSKLSILLNNGLPQPNSIVSQPLAFSELLENLKKEYRLVLIDGASLAHAESISMVPYCYGVYLVVRLGHSSPNAVRRASEIIAQAGGKLLGCIAVGDVLAPA